MTQSQDNSKSKSPAAKTPKVKGPIRIEAVVPIAIIFAVTALYFSLFFDQHLKKGLEYGATHANGAEVDIASVRTSFFEASMQISDIQVTDIENPSLNKIKIAKIKWQMLWDALLRGKIVIHEASVLGVEISSRRSSPGYVLPKDPPSESKFEKLSGQALENAEKEFAGNIFGDIAGLLGGADPKDQLKNLEANLKSEARIKELQNELSGKQKEWQTRIAKLPQNKEIQELQTRIKDVKPGNLNNPAELQASIQQIAAIVQDANSKYKVIKETTDAFNTDFNKYNNIPKEIESLVQSDIKDLEGKLKIPKLDTDSLAKVLFGPATLSKLKSAQFYMNKARQYIPPKKIAAAKAEEESKKLKPEQRAKGKNYAFGRPHSYPLFWLQKAVLSSKSSDSEYSGDMKGELKNLTNDQNLAGAPTTLSFQGNFPKQEFFGVHGLLSIDHRGDDPIESLDLGIDTIKVANKDLLKSNDVQIGFKSAEANSKFKIELKGESVNLTSNTKFQKIDYNVSAKIAALDELLKKAFHDIPEVGVQASATGPWTALKFNIETNIAHDLQAAFQKQIQSKINEAQAHLKSLIENKISGERTKLMSQVTSEQNKIKGELGSKQAEIDKAKAQVTEGQNKAGNSQKKAAEDLGKQKLNDLKKQLGF